MLIITNRTSDLMTVFCSFDRFIHGQIAIYLCKDMKFECDCKDADEVAELPMQELEELNN